MGATGPRCLQVVLVLVFVLGLGGLGEGCWEQEKLGLLQLKHFFRNLQYALYDWVEEEGKESSDCCQWERVVCDAASGRVIGLSLSDLFMYEFYSPEADYSWKRAYSRQYRYLNASLFLPFEELKSLSLSGNQIADCLHNEGFEKLALKLKKLEVLDLSYNYFNDSSILSSFVEFSSLKSLNLSYNRLRGQIHTTGFENLAFKLKKLEVIDLSLNYLNDSSILLSLVEFPSLKSLNLSFNQLSGPIHTTGLEKLAFKLKKLEVLDLTLNNFNDDSIFSFLAEFSSLKSLNLSNNQLSGPIHTADFEKLALKLKKLEVLDLSNNYFNDSSILSSLVKLSSLKSLYLSRNKISGPNHATGFGGLSTKSSSLEIIDLSGNELDDNILVSLSELSSIKYLDLSYNYIIGSIHIGELNNLINLKELHLRGQRIESLGSFRGLINLEVLSLTLGDNYIVSFLGPFSTCLKYLDINGNVANSEGSIDIKDARGLKNLKGLDGVLASNNSVLLQQSLDLFPSLKTLHFELESSINNVTVAIQELRNLTNLEELRLEETFLHTRFLEDIRELTSLRVLSQYACRTSGRLPIQGQLELKSLESLNLDGIYLHSSFLEKIGAMTSLKTLSLSSCGLSGNFSSFANICQLTRLRKLDVRDNNLRGGLPDCFSNLTFLGYLDLSTNQFSGNLAMSPLQSLTSIEYLDLSNNHFQIPISLKPFFNHSRLKYFSGDNNIIYAESELHSLAPRFQLNVISLSCCGDVGPLPKFLHHQHELRFVELSNINMTGEFPSWLLENNTELGRLFLTNNSLSEHFRLPSHSPMMFWGLEVSNNLFTGHIPEEIGVYLPDLQYLNLSKNSLHGSIPTSIGDMKSLGTLDLSNNRLQGQIFSANFNLAQLQYLHLAGNNFTGSIPSSLSNCSGLTIIDIGFNHLSGRIPTWMGSLSLIKIIMPGNHIEGPIPMELCQLYIGVLDLSMNNISGTLPPCLNQSSINHVHLSKNRLRGPIPEGICKSFKLVTLDLSDNQLTGNIPSCLGNLSDLSYLSLKHNNLEGEIPNQLCQLDKLSLIDLSHNNLSGRIPNCLNVTAYEEVAGDSTYYTLPYDAPIDGPSSSRSFETDGSIELTTKNTSYFYKGRILRYLSGIDLSCNKLTGGIPHEMGNFHSIVMLNLSHNSLSGPIPPSLSNLKDIESLDLSYNNLSGSIPFQFVHLHFLAYFNVSYNNLSGNPPPRTAQFATDFDWNSYWGNPFLCGEPLPNCPTTSNQSTKDEDKEDDGLIDIESFFVTFTVSYIVVLLSIAFVMYINPHWRRAWFFLIERGITFLLAFYHRRFR